MFRHSEPVLPHTRLRSRSVMSDYPTLVSAWRGIDFLPPIRQTRVWLPIDTFPMAHRRVDVRAINDVIRSARQDSLRLGRGAARRGEERRGEGGEREGRAYLSRPMTAAESCPGDWIVFLENNRDLSTRKAC